jgi:hypothetical protein
MNTVIKIAAIASLMVLVACSEDTPVVDVVVDDVVDDVVEYDVPAGFESHPDSVVEAVAEEAALAEEAAAVEVVTAPGV